MLVSKIVRSCWGCVLRTRWVRAAEKIPRGGEGESSKEHGDEEEETKDPKDQQAADHPQERVAATVSVTTTVVTVIVVVAVTTVVVVIVVPTSVPAVPASAWRRGHDRPRRRTGAGRAPGNGRGGVGPTAGGSTDACSTATPGRPAPGGTTERLATTSAGGSSTPGATTSGTAGSSAHGNLPGRVHRSTAASTDDSYWSEHSDTWEGSSGRFRPLVDNNETER